MTTERGAVMQRSCRLCDLVGSLAPGLHPLEGKSFYLDEVKSRPSDVITEVLARLGGKVESFLHKDVGVVITGNREVLTDRLLDQSSAAFGKVKDETVCSSYRQREKDNNDQRLGTSRPPVCGSRGKALLEKAIRSHEKSQGTVLANARSWGVKIVAVENFLKCVDQLTFELSTHKSKRNEKKASESSALRIVKACALKADFLKVEDTSRKYRPLHAQSLSLTMLSYTGRFTPFEPPAPPQTVKKREGELSQDTLGKNEEEPISSYDKPSAPLLHSPSPRPARKKSLGYCECCQISYKDQDEHLQSDVHRQFVEDINNYAVVDKLVDGMTADFLRCPDQQDDKRITGSPHCPPAPVRPSAQLEHLTRSETERACQAITNQATDHLLATISTNTVNTEQAFDPVCDPLIQETVLDGPPQTSFESKIVDEKVNVHLLLQPRPETHILNLCLNDTSCAIPDCELLSQITKPVSYSSHNTELDGQLAGVDQFCPKQLQRPAPSVVDNECLSPSSNIPQQQLCKCHNRKSALAERRDVQIPAESIELPLNVCLTERDQSTERKSSVDVSSCFVSSHCCTYLSTAINPRKRSRSFTFSPRRSKKMRMCWWLGQKSDPTYQNVAISKKYGATHRAPLIQCGLLSVAEKSVANVPLPINPPPAKPFQQSFHTNTTFREDCLFIHQDQRSNCEAQERQVTEPYTNRTSKFEFPAPAVTRDMSSELGPPQLHPFYHEDIQVQQTFPYPPKLVPAVSLIFPSEKPAQIPASHESSTSILSQSFSSVCIESALIPDITFSPTSSESDWDSGLLSRLAPSVQLQPRGGHYEQDLGNLLQRSCVGVQDGSYASQLCSVLQPTVSSNTAFRDAVNLNTLYRPIETVDRPIIQSLGM
uniref:Protein DBF4 homolog A-like n=1 Tax=Astyanax mexicanus TaxID=7994 RepID=A0A3B1IKR9_ASTMX